jgi:hypothetical protein
MPSLRRLQIIENLDQCGYDLAFCYAEGLNRGQGIMEQREVSPILLR